MIPDFCIMYCLALPVLSEERSDSVSLCWPGGDLRSESPNVKLLSLKQRNNEMTALLQGNN